MSNFLALMEATYAPPPAPKTRRRTAKYVRRQLADVGIDGLLNVTRHDDGTYTASFEMPLMDWRRRGHFGRVLAKQRATEIEYLFGYEIVEHGVDFKRADSLRFNGQTTPMVTFKLSRLDRAVRLGNRFEPPTPANVIPFERGGVNLGTWGVFTPNAMSAIPA